VARGLLALVVGLSLGSIYIAVLVNRWNAVFYNALQAFDRQLALVFPLLVAAPRYCAREIMRGGLMQTAQAFAQVQSALTFIVNTYPDIARWRAAVDRLVGFERAVGGRPRGATAPDSSGLPTDADLERALALCGVAHLARRLDDEQNWPQGLSLNEQKRLAFARLLSQRPDVIFLDETTSGLDDESALDLCRSCARNSPAPWSSPSDTWARCSSCTTPTSSYGAAASGAERVRAPSPRGDRVRAPALGSSIARAEHATPTSRPRPSRRHRRSPPRRPPTRPPCRSSRRPPPPAPCSARNRSRRAPR